MSRVEGRFACRASKLWNLRSYRWNLRVGSKVSITNATNAKRGLADLSRPSGLAASLQGLS